MNLPGLGLEDPDEDFGQFGTSQGGGLGSGAGDSGGGPAGGGPVRTTTYDLAKETEWRFECALGRSVEVKITNGTAELFGTELVTGRPYTFIGANGAIYTWTGCTIEVTCEATALSSEYIAEETGMNEYINTHFALESLREKAAATSHNVENGVRDLNLTGSGTGSSSMGWGQTGPRVLLLGPDNAGKTTLAKMLTGFAIRSGRSPIVVNLDPGQGLMSLPGTLTATVFKTLLEVDGDAGAGWGTSPMSGPNGEIPVKLPLVYYYASMDPAEKNGSVFKAQVNRLALAVQGRMSMPGQEEVRNSGLIVDMPGSLVTGKNASSGYEIVNHIVSEFAINVIICIGSERMYSDMVKKFDRQPTSAFSRLEGAERELISVIKVLKSGGVVERDVASMRAMRESQVRTYFYGNPKVGAGISLQPRQQQVDFDSLPTVWRRISPNSTYTSGGMNDDSGDTFLPGDADDSEYAPPATIPGMSSSVPLPASQIFERMSSLIPAMRNCVLAVMNCPPDPESGAEQDVLRDSSVMGFVYVTEIDEARGKVSLLSPVAGRVPQRALIWGEAIDGVFGITG